MYHDQEHILVKLLGFEDRSRQRPLAGAFPRQHLGLPIIRTSVSHGTGFDIAAKGIANERSLTEAIEYAESLAANATPA